MGKEKITLVPALDKGLKILEILSRSQDFLTMSQLAKKLGYKVSEVQRMVEYLYQNEYIQKNSQKGFYISSKFYAMTSRVDFDQIIINRASPLMNHFSLESQESLQLSVLSDRELRMLLHTEGSRHLRISIKPGVFNPMHTVSGQLLISHLSEIEQKKFELTDEDLTKLKNIRSEHDKKGYWMGESFCFQGIYKITALISIPNTLKTAALTCSFLLPMGHEITEYRQSLLEMFLDTRELIEEAL